MDEAYGNFLGVSQSAFNYDAGVWGCTHHRTKMDQAGPGCIDDWRRVGRLISRIGEVEVL